MPLALHELDKFNDIVIQCHDNPDADSLASGFALYLYLDFIGKNPRFVYGGRNPISKSNLLLMIHDLHIPIEHLSGEMHPELLVTVDCQYGESNVEHIDADNIAVIDHHQVSDTLPELSEVRSSYGSCSTIMYELLQKENVDINDHEELATALYYGLLTDTGGFTEISHPADKDLRDFAIFNQADIIKFRNSNISREELFIAGDALKHADYHLDGRYAIVRSEPCDPNILGIISDMLLEVDTVDTCVVYCILPFGVKVSVRSCIKEVKACEMAEFIAEGFGGGGGHLVKAGGLLKKELLLKDGIGYDAQSISRLISERTESYFKDIEIIYARQRRIDINQLKHYVKKETRMGYIRATDVAKTGESITIRTMEGDVDVVVESGLYIMIGIDGEVTLSTRDRFETEYYEDNAPYVFPGEYEPVAVSVPTGLRIALLPYAHSCVTSGGAGIFARQIDHRVKLFSYYDEDRYSLGRPGDYLAVRADDMHDVSVISRDLFDRIYERV